MISKPFPDQLTYLPDGSLIQHGPYNDRIYLMKPGENLETLPVDLIAMARRHDYSKVFIKIPAKNSTPFSQAGYGEEASIPRLYNGSESGVFMGFYLDALRASEPETAALDKIMEQALGSSEKVIPALDRGRFRIRRCRKKDAEKMAAIYGAVFATYPFPIHDPAFLRESMACNVEYYGVEETGHLIALASAEMDRSGQNVEMTDFATLPEWCGNGLAIQLLLQMDGQMKKKGLKTAYTIARARSVGINIIFAKLGYKYGGRLKNNTNISGKVESMNIWYKIIS